MNKMRQDALNELHKPKEIQSKNQIFEQVKAERKFLMEAKNSWSFDQAKGLIKLT